MLLSEKLCIEKQYIYCINAKCKFWYQFISPLTLMLKLGGTNVHSSVKWYKEKASVSLTYKLETSTHVSYSSITYLILSPGHFFFFPFPFLLPSPCWRLWSPLPVFCVLVFNLGIISAAYNITDLPRKQKLRLVYNLRGKT